MGSIIVVEENTQLGEAHRYRPKFVTAKFEAANDNVRFEAPLALAA